MATASPAPAPSAPAPSAQVVGNAFVEQYYHILHQSPELVFRFYQDSSVVSRPGPDGVMTSVTTMNAIDEKIRSLAYNDYKAEIKTADAQESHKGGVIVLVTGCLTGKDNVGKRFTQSFFLAPQDKGYFVLNDVFRYVDENVSVEANPIPVSVNGISENIETAPLPPAPEPSNVPVAESTTVILEEELSNGEEVYDPPADEKSVVVDEKVVEEAPVQTIENESHPLAEPTDTIVAEDAPKTYASILKLMKANAVSSPVYVPVNTTKVLTSTAKVAPATVGKQVSTPKPSEPAAPAPAQEAAVSSNTNTSESIVEEVEGHSIYIKNLPLNASVAQVEEEFKKFGMVKPGGVQVRSNKQTGFCFGFVEFELLSSMNSAVEASSIIMSGRQVFIEEKKTTTRVGGGGGGRGRFPPARGGFRNDFRGRGGNFGGGRGYVRNDFGNRGDFSGRRGPQGRGGDGYQRVDPNSNGRVGVRQGGISETAATA